jgi:hypothetical protein
MSVTRSLEVLDTTNTAQIHTRLSVLTAYDDGIIWLQDCVHRLVFKKMRVSETVPVLECIRSDKTPYVPPPTLEDANRFSFQNAGGGEGGSFLNTRRWTKFRNWSSYTWTMHVTNPI